MSTPSRKEVYEALDSERNYQRKWETESESKGVHSISEFLAYMEDYIDEAQHVLAREARQIAYPKVVHILRKVTALGVACMEQHGAPRREGF